MMIIKMISIINWRIIFLICILLSENVEWVGQWGKHMKSVYFKLITDHQKMNHFPGTFVIGRKDRLWRSYSQLRIKFGKKQ